MKKSKIIISIIIVVIIGCFLFFGINNFTGKYIISSSSSSKNVTSASSASPTPSISPVTYVASTTPTAPTSSVKSTNTGSLCTLKVSSPQPNCIWYGCDGGSTPVVLTRTSAVRWEAMCIPYWVYIQNQTSYLQLNYQGNGYGTAFALVGSSISGTYTSNCYSRAQSATVTEGANEICDNGIDDNANNITDCAEFCCNGQSCLVGGIQGVCNYNIGKCVIPEICDNNKDDNYNGRTDCDEYWINATACDNKKCNNTNLKCTDSSGVNLCFCQKDSCLAKKKFYPDCDNDKFGDVNSNYVLAFDSTEAKALGNGICNYTLNNTDCNDNDNRTYPGTAAYFDDNINIGNVCDVCNSDGTIGWNDTVSPNLNPESYKNCYVCSATQKKLMAVNNNQKGDGDCMYCEGIGGAVRASTDKGTYFDKTKNVAVRDRYGVISGWQNCENAGCENSNSADCLAYCYLPGDSLQTTEVPTMSPLYPGGKMIKQDCKKCIWNKADPTNPGMRIYSYRQPSSNQASLGTDDSEDLANSGSECSKCQNGELVADDDSRVSDQAVGVISPYLCQQCIGVSLGFNDQDPRVMDSKNRVNDLSLACKTCSSGLVNLSDGSSSPDLKQLNLCCGGNVQVFALKSDRLNKKDKDNTLCCSGKFCSAGDTQTCGSCNKNCGNFASTPFCYKSVGFFQDCFNCVECRSNADCPSKHICTFGFKTCLGIWPPFSGVFTTVVKASGADEAIQLVKSRYGGQANQKICGGTGSEAATVQIISIASYFIPGAPVGSATAFKIVYKLVALGVDG